MAKNTGSFLGTGWSFPPAFNKIHESVAMVAGIRDIEESIHLILNTIPGERIMQPEFGCDLKRLTFEIDDSSLIAAFEHMIYHALLNFEPRVNYINTRILDRQELDGILYLQINYSIITTNTRHNIVFPFYLHGEGTNVSV